MVTAKCTRIKSVDTHRSKVEICLVRLSGLGVMAFEATA
jgi:hypothetical protein